MSKKVEGKVIDNYQGFEWDEYEQTPLMSTYSLAIAIFNNHTPFMKDFPKENGTFNITAWVKDTNSIAKDKIDRHLDRAAKFHSFMENYLKKPDVLEKLDNLEVRNIEHEFIGTGWGLTKYNYVSEENDIYDENKISNMDFSHIISHEIAQSWLGNAISSENWHEYVIYKSIDL